MAIDMNDLYSKNPGTQDATATNATAATATGRDATATGYDAKLGTVTDDMTSAGQAQKIMGTDSPLMQQAKSSGMLTAASRGLMNSSISAGASEAEMAKAAVPLAQQDAQTYFNQGLTNDAATNRASEFTAGAKNTADLQNSALATDVSKFNAGMQTDVSKGNADRAYDASRTNATAANSMRQTILQQNADLNKQFLTGNQALDLQTIGKKYDVLIQNNQAAASLYNSMMNTIGQAMTNPKLAPATMASYVQTLQKMLDGGLQVMDTISGVDLSTFAPPVDNVGAGGLPMSGAGPAGNTTQAAVNPGSISVPGYPTVRSKKKK